MPGSLTSEKEEGLSFQGESLMHCAVMSLVLKRYKQESFVAPLIAIWIWTETAELPLFQVFLPVNI